jgi:transcriptional repressor NF-X1
MAEALQLENPDLETRLGPPNYSEFLKKFAQKNPQFVEMVHTKLTDLVMSSKKSKKTNVTYAFDCMNREKRTVVHEYSVS